MYQPVIPLSGLAGWAFLNRTMDRQTEFLAKSQPVKNDITYFRENIATVKTAQELVEDRRLLKVALGAFGLSDDIANKHFIQEILESSRFDDKSLANRMSDRRYRAMAKEFGFGDFATPNTQLSNFPDKIIAAYKLQSFEVAVGEQDNNLRLAIGAERKLGEIADEKLSNDGKWYTVLGSPPLRKVFETAMGLPSAISRLDIERQLSVFKERSEKIFGTSQLGDFANSDKSRDLVRNFLVRSEIGLGPPQFTSRSIAVSLLQNSLMRK